MRDDVKRVIEEGHDAMADRFAALQRGIEGSTQVERVEALIALLPEQPESWSSASEPVSSRAACSPSAAG